MSESAISSKKSAEANHAQSAAIAEFLKFLSGSFPALLINFHLICESGIAEIIASHYLAKHPGAFIFTKQAILLVIILIKHIEPCGAVFLQHLRNFGYAPYLLVPGIFANYIPAPLHQDEVNCGKVYFLNPQAFQPEKRFI